MTTVTTHIQARGWATSTRGKGFNVAPAALSIAIKRLAGER
ncbi:MULTISPECIES: hypothetical protein [Nocardia]|nr:MULTISPECIES: hypothetical protein [Nocardia]